MDFLTLTIWILICVLIVGLLTLVWNNGQLRARLDGLDAMLKHQAEDFKRELEKQADTFTVQLGQVNREAAFRIAAMREEWIHTRQRWTVTASQFLVAKEWIRILAAELRLHGLVVPIPPNVEELSIDRRPDESVHFPEIEAAAEFRLDSLIAEIAEANKQEDRGPLNG